jgi:hypothetical protein
VTKSPRRNYLIAEFETVGGWPSPMLANKKKPQKAGAQLDDLEETQLSLNSMRSGFLRWCLLSHL